MLDLGNSGTSARLLTGILASHRFTSFMTGDGSLRWRPMQRVMEPLGRMGARFEAREGGRMPLAIVGTDEMVPIEYTLPVASAQVKSCILLAGLNTAGETTVIEPEATRDHTERMLRHFGAEVRVAPVDRRPRQAHHGGRLAGAQGARHRRAGRSLVGGLRRRRRGGAAGQRRAGRECRRQSLARRALHDAEGNGRRHRLRERARGRRRAGGRPAREGRRR